MAKVPKELAILLFLQRRENPITVDIVLYRVRDFPDENSQFDGILGIENCSPRMDENGFESWTPDFEVMQCRECGWVCDIIQGQSPKCRQLCSACRDLEFSGYLQEAKQKYNAFCGERARKEMERRRQQQREIDRVDLRREVSNLLVKYPRCMDGTLKGDSHAIIPNDYTDDDKFAF